MTTIKFSLLVTTALISSMTSSCGKKSGTDSDAEALNKEQTKQVNTSNFEKVNKSKKGLFLQSKAELPLCNSATENSLFYVLSEKTFYMCFENNYIAIDPLKGENGKDGLVGKDGANGAAGTNGLNGVKGANGAAGTNGTNGNDGSNGTNGAGTTPAPLFKLDESSVVSAGSNGDETNAFRDGKDYRDFESILNSVDEGDYGSGSDFVAPKNYTEGVTGRINEWGCLQLNLENIFSNQGNPHGTILAKVGLQSLGEPLALQMRFETAMQVFQGGFLLHPIQTVQLATKEERIFYPTVNSVMKTANLCFLGSEKAPVNVRIYQVFLWE